mmetsp:Transcript_44364/g.89076  ORF Transcript_44364/g.89076 Transcript_44364/m.89076 type:complete len:132 (+) Transcript_44364:1-396(+)
MRTLLPWHLSLSSLEQRQFEVLGCLPGVDVLEWSLTPLVQRATMLRARVAWCHHRRWRAMPSVVSWAGSMPSVGPVPLLQEENDALATTDMTSEQWSDGPSRMHTASSKRVAAVEDEQARAMRLAQLWMGT